LGEQISFDLRAQGGIKNILQNGTKDYLLQNNVAALAVAYRINGKSNKIKSSHQ